jgi:hypothetical protein
MDLSETNGYTNKILFKGIVSLSLPVPYSFLNSKCQMNFVSKNDALTLTLTNPDPDPDPDPDP